jgi:hypothetical protein
VALAAGEIPDKPAVDRSDRELVVPWSSESTYCAISSSCRILVMCGRRERAIIEDLENRMHPASQ